MQTQVVTNATTFTLNISRSKKNHEYNKSESIVHFPLKLNESRKPNKIPGLILHNHALGMRHIVVVFK